MSKFSGKCDFYDEIEIFGWKNIRQSTIYIGDSNTPLRLAERADAIEYYPYIVTSSYMHNGIGAIHLSEKSWVDMCEERYGHHAVYDLYRGYLLDELRAHGR